MNAVKRVWRWLGRGVMAAIVLIKYLACFALLSPRRMFAFTRSLGHWILNYDHGVSQARLPERTLEQLLPGLSSAEIVFADAIPRDGNLALIELYVLCALAKLRDARLVLEMGTFDGLVMANLARNTDGECRLITLDLKPEQLASLSVPLDPGEVDYVRKSRIGERIHRLPEPLRGKVAQIYGDSLRTDFSAYYGRADMVFVDASHAYAYVKHDSEEALKLRSPRGIVVWHDYLAWPDVSRCLNELGNRLPLVRVAGTSLVLYGLNAP